MWNFATITGETAVNIMLLDVRTLSNSVSGLTMTSTAKPLFVQSLGLYGAGVVALDVVQDYGSITSTISMSPCFLGCKPTASFVPEVPEPSSWALMGLGLLGVAAVARQRA